MTAKILFDFEFSSANGKDKYYLGNWLTQNSSEPIENVETTAKDSQYCIWAPDAEPLILLITLSMKRFWLLQVKKSCPAFTYTLSCDTAGMFSLIHSAYVYVHYVSPSATKRNVVTVATV